MKYWNAVGRVRVAIPESVVPKSSLGDILAGRCMCGGDLDRISFRDVGTDSRPWRAFGYRCYSCGTLYIDEAVTHAK